MVDRVTWVSLGFILFAFLACYGIVTLDRAITRKGNVLGPVEHWPEVIIHGSGNREHTIEYNGQISFQRFCLEGPDPFYEGMTVDLYFQRYEKCWQIVNYTIRRDMYGNPAEANQAAR